MDPHSFIARAEAQRWIGIAEKLLMGQDFVGSKTFAIRARESDPRLETADQILAVADTLLAAETRVVGKSGSQQPDFYAILQLVRLVHDADHIAAQYRRLAVLLNPNQNRFPYSDQAFQLVNDAWAVLSNPRRKSMYDSDLDFPIGFNLEQQHHHHQHHRQHQQQHQHNFFSINRVNSGDDREPPQMCESRVEQPQQLQQHNFLSQSNPNPIRPVPVREPEQVFEPQIQPFHITPQPPLSQPQAPPPLQPKPEPEVQQQKQVLEQNVDLGHVNSDNGVREEEIEIKTEAEAETETEAAVENVDDSPTFWTACPYCFYMYEYPRLYTDCTLRCDNCKRAFQAVPIPPPPPIIEGKESYFTCWGFLPLGVSASHLDQYNGTRTNSNWTPFSPLQEALSNVEDHSHVKLSPKKNSFVPKNLGPRIYIDDFTDDVFTGIVSEPSDESDVEWGSGSTKRKKAKRMKKGPDYDKKTQAMAKARQARKAKAMAKKQQHDIPVQEGSEAPSKKAVGSNPRRQSGRVKKELGKLDLNVEFNNNEGEEPAPGMTVGHGQGEEDNIEGNGFFEGLDEFLSSLPILSVVNDVKVKAA